MALGIIIAILMLLLPIILAIIFVLGFPFLPPGSIAIIIFATFLTILLMIGILRSRYRKFMTNVYVIHFRNGRVRYAGLGGAFFLLPIIDDFTCIPTTAIKVDIDAERVISAENQELIVRGFLVWRVVDPAKTFTSVRYEDISKILKDIAESVIRTTCAKMKLIDILRERKKIINAIVSELEDIVADWGIKIETVEIREVDVVNKDLLKSLQAEMFWDQWKKAGLMEQQSKQEVGVREKEREKIIGLKEKEKEIALAQRDIEISKLRAEAERQRKIIEAEAEKQSKIIVAQGEAEAEYIQLIKRAEGLKQLNQVITDKLISYELVQKLPEVTKALRESFQNAIFIGSPEQLGNVIAGILGTIYSITQKLPSETTKKALKKALQESKQSNK